MQLTEKSQRSGQARAALIGDLAIEAAGLQETAQAFVDYCRSPARESARRPIYSTSVNGQIVSLCAADPSVAEMFRTADSISADGQPLVLLSRLLCKTPLPERVATTDLFPQVARLAQQAGLTFYMLGGAEDVNRRAFEATRAAYPSLRIVGRRNGYFSPDEGPAVAAAIAQLRPDILWLALGAPLEQQFCAQNLDALKGVGIVKTSGGLFDFVAGAKPRAPLWMQRSGLEWLFRLAVEPRRLFLRYLITNPHALLVLARDMR